MLPSASCVTSYISFMHAFSWAQFSAVGEYWSKSMSNTTLTSESKMNLAKTMLKQMIDRRMLTAMEACVRCGICTASCHYYRSDPKPEHAPFYRAEQLRRLYRQFFDPVGRGIPGWFGAGVSRGES